MGEMLSLSFSTWIPVSCSSSDIIIQKRSIGSPERCNCCSWFGIVLHSAHFCSGRVFFFRIVAWNFGTPWGQLQITHHFMLRYFVKLCHIHIIRQIIPPYQVTRTWAPLERAPKHKVQKGKIIASCATAPSTWCNWTHIQVNFTAPSGDNALTSYRQVIRRWGRRWWTWPHTLLCTTLSVEHPVQYFICIQSSGAKVPCGLNMYHNRLALSSKMQHEHMNWWHLQHHHLHELYLSRWTVTTTLWYEVSKVIYTW